MEWLGGNRRRDRILNRAKGDVLEVGIGTGRNLEHYPPGVRLTGIDVSEAMLRRARQRAERLDTPARLERADVQALALEHVRPHNPLLGWLADRLSPLTRRLIGPDQPPHRGEHRHCRA